MNEFSGYEITKIETDNLSRRLTELGFSIFGAQILESINRVVNDAYDQGRCDGKRDEAIRICDLLLNEADLSQGLRKLIMAG